MKFAITGLPRSRTKWASVFLSTPDTPVIHDPDFQAMEAAKAISTPLFLQVWEKHPDLKVVLIERPFADVVDSMYKFGNHLKWLNEAYNAKEQMKVKHKNLLILDFYELDAKALWEFCHGTEVTDEYVKVYEDMNIQQQSMDLRRVA